jgi:hypothetical protein
MLVFIKKKFWLKSFGRPLEYPFHVLVLQKSEVPKLYSTPLFRDAAGVVYIKKFYHYLANHYITETITKLPATAELPMPPLHCCCRRRAAAALPEALPPSASLSVICVVVRRLCRFPSSALLSVVCVLIHRLC